MSLDKKLPEIPDFDPDFTPNNPHNVEAAKARNLTYDNQTKAYLDEDGLPIRDEYGQEL